MAPKILIVDDEPNIVTMVAFRLKSLGYEVQTASDGAKALDLMAVSLPDLLILDLMMPAPDGYQICRMLKEDPRFQKVPIVILTAQCTENEEQLKTEIKADACLRKPYSPEELSVLVKQLLSAGESGDCGKE